MAIGKGRKTGKVVSIHIAETDSRIIGRGPETHPKHQPDEIRQAARKPQRKSPVSLDKAAGLFFARARMILLSRQCAGYRPGQDAEPNSSGNWAGHDRGRDLHHRCYQRKFAFTRNVWAWAPIRTWEKVLVPTVAPAKVWRGKST